MAFSPLWRRQGMRGLRVSSRSSVSSPSSSSSPSSASSSPVSSRSDLQMSDSSSSSLFLSVSSSTSSARLPCSLTRPSSGAAVSHLLCGSRRAADFVSPQTGCVFSRAVSRVSAGVPRQRALSLKKGDTLPQRPPSHSDWERGRQMSAFLRRFLWKALASPRVHPSFICSGAFCSADTHPPSLSLGREESACPSGVSCSRISACSFSTAHAASSPLFPEKFLSESGHPSSRRAPPSEPSPEASPFSSPSSASPPSASSCPPPPSSVASSSPSVSDLETVSSVSVCEARPSFFAFGASQEAQLRTVLPLLETSTDPRFLTNLLLSLHALPDIWPHVLVSPSLRSCRLVFPVHSAPSVSSSVSSSVASPLASAVSNQSPQAVPRLPSEDLYSSYLAQFKINETHVDGLLRAAAPASLDLLLLLSLVPHVGLAQLPSSEYKPQGVSAASAEASADGVRPAKESPAVGQNGQETLRQVDIGGNLKIDLREALPLLLAAYHPQRPGADRDLTSLLVLHFTEASLLLLSPSPSAPSSLSAPSSSLPSSLPSSLSSLSSVTSPSQRSMRHQPQAFPQVPSAPATSPAVRPELALWLQHTVLSLTPQTLRFVPQLPIRLAAALHAANVRLPLLPSPSPLHVSSSSPSSSSHSSPAAPLHASSASASAALSPSFQASSASSQNAGSVSAVPRHAPISRGWKFGKPREEISSPAGVAQWEVVDQVGAVVLLNQLDVIEKLLWKINWSKLSVSAACRFFRESFDSRHLVLSGLAMQKAFASLSSRFGLLQVPDVFHLLAGIQHLQVSQEIWKMRVFLGRHCRFRSVSWTPLFPRL
ncbi:hypothetical protein TGPRC2_270150A [Toxoplasma gondii TgCatPRC2]|uniref:Uncharacterized protein n=1 Tax=Toxoplasma gondii TgCatPRC2 TaxID=1130821 RepID=A0A151HNU7_TOXGO|nr:hypothetical protein TGPRC2_270150A [Toxoplasma gondii TgCatPRC2]